MNLIFQFQDVQLARQVGADLLQALGHVERLQEVLARFQGQVDHLRDDVGQLARIAHVHRVDVGFFGESLVQIDGLFEHRQDGPYQRLDVRALLEGFRQCNHIRHQIRHVLGVFEDFYPLDALHDGAGAAVGQADRAGDNDFGAYLVEVFRFGKFIRLGVVLCDNDEGPILLNGDF